ncbi:DUF1345 domain-containing protein [Methyloligella sp. 2.7D]|uniref:DUF1345 domain-containing protein n=1 Tax=unclassified Methyloligella TaxID=2625955 RepID=UPI00157DBA1B|nr:DUF1345 domain-containing protein [Methyloligella sp. GL2]QKP76453.1 DUF1345 domain-containing protein [Methyloligella sp. GL2]
MSAAASNGKQGSAKPKPARHRRPSFIGPKLRLVIAAAAGVTTALLVPATETITRILLSWDAFGLVYIVLALWTVFTVEEEGIKRAADVEERSRTVVLALVVVCALAMLLAIGAQLAALNEAKTTYRDLKFVLTVATILVSWFLVHIVYGLFYAHEYHVSRHRSGEAGAGLRFPGDPAPDYFDFLYFAFVVGTTAQTSDVLVTSRRMRRIVTVHGLLSFFLNTAVIALGVNLTVQLAG